ncbi:hypothetical protein DRR64_28150 [Escherichia coli]|nr:hypothetical protein [Escherichia coli]
MRVTFALNCCDREAIAWAVSMGGYDKATVQDVMSGAIEKRFGDRPECLTDNGSAYTAHETQQIRQRVESGKIYNSS